MARALATALRLAGYEVAPASNLRLFLDRPDHQRQRELEDQAEREVESIAHRWHELGHPSAWFTYHNHYKAPDLLGPDLSRRFAIPYIVAEASHAPRRAETWTTWAQAAETASRSADVHICFTPRDRVGLADLFKSGATILDLPPFLEIAAPDAPDRPRRPGPVRLITVAMMRPGDKLASYKFLAASLGLVTELDWTLDIVGDGPAQSDVRSAFAALPPNALRWHGELPPENVRNRLAEADLLVWPGFGEAFGLAYLEAQAMGVPVVALDVAGVASVVSNGMTGVLVLDQTPPSFAAAISNLIRDPGKRLRFGAAAAHFVRSERTLANATRQLGATIQAAIDRYERQRG